MARILFLTQVLPYPLNAGPKMRAYYVLRHLARSHRVTLVSFVRSEDPPEAIEHLATFCEAVHTVPMVRSLALNLRAGVKAVVTGQPLIIVRDEIAAMHALLRRLVSEQRLDVVHADQTSMAQYGLYARDVAPAAHRPRAVFDVHNALYRIYAQMAQDETRPLWRTFYRRETRALRRYEQRLWSQFDAAVFVSEYDRAAVGAPLEDRPGLTTIPICAAPADKALVPKTDRPRTVLHLGTMFWPPNVQGMLWFAREVWPIVAAQEPEARLVIIGRRPPAEVEALGRDPRIEVTGYVEDPTSYLADTAAFLVPLHAGAGMRVKIMDAWSWGTPVVTTTLGAEGIDVHDGDDALVADDAPGYAAAVLRLLREPALRQRLRENGHRQAQTAYNWEMRYAEWDRVYRAVLDL
jgi:glycosyltransferase involved in cell wall biosynthesis